MTPELKEAIRAEAERMYPMEEYLPDDSINTRVLKSSADFRADLQREGYIAAAEKWAERLVEAWWKAQDRGYFLADGPHSHPRAGLQEHLTSLIKQITDGK